MSGLEDRLTNLEGRMTVLESVFREFRNETGSQLDRIEGLFTHVAKKWMEHDADISNLKRRQA